MSVDVERATNGFETFQELWAAVLTIIVACTMLWIKAGYVMFAPLLFIITLIGTTSMCSSTFLYRLAPAESIRFAQSRRGRRSEGVARDHGCPDQAPRTLCSFKKKVNH
jgi:hypothetical protein